MKRNRFDEEEIIKNTKPACRPKIRTPRLQAVRRWTFDCALPDVKRARLKEFAQLRPRYMSFGTYTSDYQSRSIQGSEGAGLGGDSLHSMESISLHTPEE